MTKLIAMGLAAFVVALSGVVRADDAAFSTAAEWLAKVKANDADAVATATALPFTYRTMTRTKACEGTVKDAAAMKSWIACFKKSQKLLIGELNAGNDVAISPEGGPLPKELAAMKKSVTGEGVWVQASLGGHGVSYLFVFFVTKPSTGQGQVKALFIEKTFDSG